MKPIKYRQRTKTGCGSFTLANIFDDHRFVLDIPKEYENFAGLNKKMQDKVFEKQYKNLYVDPRFITCYYFKNGNKMTVRQMDEFFTAQRLDVKDATAVIPYLITINRRNGTNHMLALLNDLSENIFYAVDSGTDYVQRLSLTDLSERYAISAICVLASWGEGSQPNILFGSKKMFDHIY